MSSKTSLFSEILMISNFEPLSRSHDHILQIIKTPPMAPIEPNKITQVLSGLYPTIDQ